jgi:hypothetical protein
LRAFADWTRSCQVPGFVKEGDIVIVRPSTGEFVKRKL